MGNANTQSLPVAVEELISAICREKSVSPIDEIARKKLLSLGEEESIRILSDIRNWRIVKNLSASIMFMAKNKITNSNSNSNSPITPPPSFSPITPTPSPCRRRSLSSPVSVATTSNPKGNSSTPSKRRTLEYSDEIVASFVEHFTASPAAAEANENMQMHNRVLDAFDELEFRKAFLILNYIGRNKLESIVSADTIERLKSIKEMDKFETEIWNEFGRDNCKEIERRKYLDWDSGKSYNYHCHVYADGSCSFKGPFLTKTTTLLQKVIGDENVLIVKFLEEEKVCFEQGSSLAMYSAALNKVIEEGIFVGQKRYQFFVFKDGGKEKKKKGPTSSPVKCYFVRLEAFASFFEKGPHFFKERSIQDARSVFMHIHTASSLSNYMARLSLILSKTITLEVNLDDVNVEVIDDVLCLDENDEVVIGEDGKPFIHTDGTGFISEDLALICPQNCFNGSLSDDHNIQRLIGAVPYAWVLPEMSQPYSHLCEPPLLIQFRMFHHGRAIKGTVLVNKKLPPKTIQVRPSMIKIKSDSKLVDAPTVNKFEIVSTSNKPKKPKLSKNLIALLHFGGVPRGYFLGILQEALTETQYFQTKKRAALRVAISRDVDEDLTLARMILSGIPLDEPFLQHRLSVIVKDEWKNLKAGKLPVADSFYLMGTADPTNTLNSGEVCVILEHGQISGPILVYRNPGIHPGDIHVVNATYVKAIEQIVGNAKYGIFFPSKGPRSMADEIAGGDYDGDMYWVSRNPELIKYFKPSAPWVCGSSSPTVDSKKPSDLSDEALERDLFRLYSSTRFHPSKAMGLAADCWLVYMDRLLTLGDDCSNEKELLMQKIIKLVDIYYDALDAPKKGKKVEVPQELIPDKYPHHMERGEFCTYKSSSILGQIHDEVDDYSHDNEIKVWKLSCFQSQIEQIPSEILLAWQLHYREYRRDMTAAVSAGDESKNESATAVYRAYKRILYGIPPGDQADELEKSHKRWEDIRIEALAAYNAAYEHALQTNDPQKCNFAWKVAGSALFKIYMDELGEKPMCCAPSVIHEMFS